MSSPARAAAEPTPAAERGTARRLHRLHRLEPLLGIVLFAVALAALYRELRGHALRDIGATLEGLPASSVALAVGLTIVGYGILTLYDYLGVGYAERRLPYRTVAPASFVSYAVSHNLGMATLTSAPLRYRFYSAAGLDATEIARIVVFVGITFWLGVVTLAGAAFVVRPLVLPPGWDAGFADSRVLGFGLLLLALGYFLLVALYRKPLRIRSFELKLPKPRLAGLQLLVATLDLTTSAGVLFVLLPAEAGVPFPRFLAIYLLALIAGLISQVPGGLGVFEAVVVTTLPAGVPGTTVLATLLAYRAIYYILPLFVAGGVLAIAEGRRHRERLAPVWRSAGTWASVVTPHVVATVVFLAGAVLLFSGSIPGLPHRLRQLGQVVPLPLIELSHLLGSVAGLGLLLVARGLQRRLDGAYLVTMGLLTVGVVASLVKGLDYEEAAILGLIFLMLLPARGIFYRKGALLGERFTPGWLVAIAVVLGTSVWLGLLAFQHVEYSGELWWRFALHGDAPRFLRAAVAVAVVAALVALAKLLGPTEHEPRPADATTIAKAAIIVADSANSSANLALIGDKTFLFSTDESGFIMYAVEGRSWVSMGDPVGPTAAQRELLWDFRSLVDRYDGWPVFYQIRAENVPWYVDLGLSLFKLGEEAIVPLGDFSLEGRSRKDLRWARRNAERAGCSFRVTTVDEVPALLPELRRVSDAWLKTKDTREKGFSLGSFDEAYLRRFPQALVTRDGAVVAFANLWCGAGREELSIDLMRHSTDAPPGVMDYLFTELMVWGKAQGYRQFSLGMAPMSGIEAHALAPLWNRVGAFLYHHAEDFYNFQGLRTYKDKFSPQWQARYLASPPGFALPRILANLATLIGGGVRGVFGK